MTFFREISLDIFAHGGIHDFSYKIMILTLTEISWVEGLKGNSEKTWAVSFEVMKIMTFHDNHDQS